MVAESPLDRGIAWGEYLASLNEVERAEAGRAAKSAYRANVPDEDVGKPPIRSLGEYLDTEIETPPELVKPFLVARGAVSAMVAKGGKGKTALSLNRLVHWSMGLPLFPDLEDVFVPLEPLRVVLIENEGSAWHFQKVLRLILEGGGFEPEHIELARSNVHVWGDGGWSGLKLDNDENLELVKRATDSTKADIVFVEPFRGLWRGEENSATEMAVVIDNLSSLANEYGCAVMVTHHERKNSVDGGEQMDMARGSGVFTDLCAVVESWRRPSGAVDQRELTWPKTRFAPAPDPVRMEWRGERWGYEWVPEDKSVRRVLGAFQETGQTELKVSEVAAVLEENQATVRRWLDKAVGVGDLKFRTGEGGKRYRLAKDRQDPNVEPPLDI